MTVSRLHAELSSQNVETPGTRIWAVSEHGREAMAKACALGAFGVRPRSPVLKGAWRSCRFALRQPAGGRNVAPTLRSALDLETSRVVAVNAGLTVGSSLHRESRAARSLALGSVKAITNAHSQESTDCGYHSGVGRQE